MSRALLYLPGRDQVFARVLGQFCDNYGQGVPGLGRRLAGGAWKEAQRLLHALRGACGAVGATALQAQALALEHQLQPLAEGVPPAKPRPGAEQVHETLHALVAAVRGRLGRAMAPTPTSVPAAALRPALERLVGQLRRAEFLAGAQFRELEPALRVALGDAAVQQLALPLARHDYEAALRGGRGPARHPAA
jgi:two-component system, sensor histidine kinase and response regulator